MGITSPLFNMFARSPLGPLQKHMQTVQNCAEELPNFIAAASAQEWQRAEKLQNTISQLENDADDLKRDLRLHLPNNLFLAVPRSDLLDILTHQDKIANKSKDIAGLILGRKMVFPEVIADNYMTLLNRSIDASKQANKAIQQLDELLETGFRGNEVKLVENMIQQLDQIEHDTDEMQITLRKDLFAVEADFPPIDMMFLYKIIEWTGDLADCAQTVGGRLQLLLAH